MTRFDDEAALANRAEFELNGEPLVLRPSNGRPRTVTAIVNRGASSADRSGSGGPEPLAGFDRALAQRIVIEFFDHEETGLASRLYGETTWKVDVAKHKGGTPETRSIVELLDDTGGKTVVMVS